MYQVIINHWGLSLGEIEAIKNNFNNYEVIESYLQKNSDYASILEIEFMKNISDEFFNGISIDKWNIFVDIIKNIKKRRGNKGLQFKLTITDYFEEPQYQDEDIKDKIELLFFRSMIFLLRHKNHNEFIKGLERIEIAIENIVELSKQTKKFYNAADESPTNQSIVKKDSVHYGGRDQQNHRHFGTNIQLYVFIFDVDKRIWRTL